jgi:arylsulfatase A-like enzyme
MNILLHQNWAGDSKLRPEVLDELGITPTSDWDKRAMEHKYNRFTPEQLASWNEVYDPVIEDFRQRYPSMTKKEQMQWKYQRYMQDYLGCIAAVDESVGTLLDYLDQEGLTENSIVVYTSDQGFYLGEHGWFDKRFIYDESFKTPLLVRWPGVVAPGSTNDEMVQNMDFAQTFLDAAGIEAPADMQGESFVPLLKGEDESWDRDAVYYHYYEYPAVHMVKRHYGIVTKEYKLAHFYYDIDEWELYDRLKDPMEMKNEYDNPEYAEVVAELKAELAGLREKYQDSEELDQKYIELYENR